MLGLLNDSLRFLIQSFFELYILLVSLRILFYWVKIQPNNPMLLMIGRMTYPPLRPIYSIMPSIYGIDLAAIFLLSTLSMLKIGILFWLQTHLIPPLSGLAILAFAEILKQFVDIFLIIIVLFNLMSWFQPLTASAFVEIIIKISDPLLRSSRGLLVFSGLDFSSFLVVTALWLASSLIITPLTQIGIRLFKAALLAR